MSRTNHPGSNHPGSNHQRSNALRDRAGKWIAFVICCLFVSLPGCGKVPTWNELTSGDKKADKSATDATDSNTDQQPSGSTGIGFSQPSDTKAPPPPSPQQVIAAFMNTRPFERTDAQLAQLAKLPSGLEEVVEMDLAGARYVTPAGLAELPNFPAIKVLKLDGAQMSGPAYAGIGGLAELEVFSAEGSQFDEVAMQYLAPLTNLRVLRLNQTRITDQSFIHLKNLRKLEEIYVQKCAITGRGFEALRGAPLRVVVAGESQFGQFGFLHLKGCSTLEELAVTRCNVTDAALVYIKGCKGLKKLWLSQNNLSNLGAKQLGAHRGLIELHLRDTLGINDIGLNFIKNMKQLEKLDLEGTGCTPRGVEALRKLLKVCTIVYQSREWKGDKAA